MNRGVIQLKYIRLRFCDFGGSSSGIRLQMLSENFNEFIDVNPEIEIQPLIKRGEHPVIFGYQRNGFMKQTCVKNLNLEDIEQRIKNLRNSAGHKSQEYGKIQSLNQTQSIQGKWKQNTNDYTNENFIELSTYNDYEQYKEKTSKFNSKKQIDVSYRDKVWADFNHEKEQAYYQDESLKGKNPRDMNVVKSDLKL